MMENSNTPLRAARGVTQQQLAEMTIRPWPILVSKSDRGAGHSAACIGFGSSVRF